MISIMENFALLSDLAHSVELKQIEHPNFEGIVEMYERDLFSVLRKRRKKLKVETT
jgi:hypothetical protein